MRMIGIIGGMSEQATALYYAHLNERTRLLFGGLRQAPCIIWSVDFQEILELAQQGRWDKIGNILGNAGKKLEAAGAEVLIIAANTMHKVADDVKSMVNIPLLHIADVTAAAIKKAGFSRPGLLATRVVTEQEFYVGRLREQFGLDVIIPNEIDRTEVQRAIFDELCKGIVRPASKASYLRIISRLSEQGADCLILGCTEFGMLLAPEDVNLPMFNTAFLHVNAALDFAMAGRAQVSVVT
jgi:aspartate racemase